ncbi:hypothetical protein EQV77_09920 [Halobacillus fulvus]|nr:hypothetical protein EQV77_09920 [Halobacillus fulvus]
MNQNKFVLLDVICYIIFPLVVWHMLRDDLGDYYAMLLTTVPGIVYTIYRFFALKKLNIFGLYMITTLVIGTLLDVMAGSALQMLWNSVLFAYVIGAFFLLTMLINKPITLFFGLDFSEMQGYDRAFSKRLFYKKKILVYFHLLTLAFALQDIALAGLKTWLIIEYGVEAFDQALILRQVINWGLTVVIVAGFFYIGNIINQSPQLIEQVEEEMKAEKQA